MGITLSELTAPSTHLAGNDIWVKAATSGIPAGATDYKILLKIVSVDGVLTGSPFVDAIEPDADGVAWFNFSGYVNQGIKSDLTWPIKTRWVGKIIGYNNRAYDIWLYGGESYVDSNGDLQEVFEAIPVQPFIILPGRIPDRMVAELNDAETTWWDKYCKDGEFFSYMPTTQQVTPYQPVKLWWIPWKLKQSIKIYLKYFIGGADATIELFTGEMYADILWEIECHPQGAGVPLTDGEGNKLEKYEVWIEDAGVIVCAKRTFNVDWTPPVEKYWYLFVDNRMGAVECLSLTGRCVLEPVGQKTVVSVPFERGSGVKTATKLAKGGNRQRKWKINSGWKPKAELEAMEYLLDAEQAWLAIPPSTGSTNIADYKLTPVIISNSEFVLSDDMEEIQSIDIELTEAL